MNNNVVPLTNQLISNIRSYSLALQDLFAHILLYQNIFPCSLSKKYLT